MRCRRAAPLGAPAAPSPRFAPTLRPGTRRVPGPLVFARVVAALAVGLGAGHMWVMAALPHGPWVGAALGAMVLLCLKCALGACNKPAALLEVLGMSAPMALAHTFITLGIHEHVHGGESPTAATTAGAAVMLGIAGSELALVMLCGIGLRLAASRTLPAGYGAPG